MADSRDKLAPDDALNPNNPVARASFGQWHAITALIMFKLGVREIEITMADSDAFAASPLKNVAIDDSSGSVKIKLLTEEESRAAVRKFGGAVGDS